MNFLRSFSRLRPAALGLTGCLQQEKLIKLKTDGSGTVEETLVMSKATIAQMKQMTEGFGALAQGKKEARRRSRSWTKRNCARPPSSMGEGVTFVSAKPMNTPTGEGFTAIYAFTDINKLKIDQNPGENMPGAGGRSQKLGNKPKKEPVKFEFTKGRPPRSR